MGASLFTHANMTTTAPTTDPQPPEGYLPLFRTSPFLDLNGPFFYKPHSADGALDQGFTVGFRVAPKHLNAKGTVHGGLFATVSDVALGYVTGKARAQQGPMLTTNLSLDYVAAAHLGDWVDVDVTIIKNGRQLALACAILRCGDRVLVSARASFMALS